MVLVDGGFILFWQERETLTTQEENGHLGERVTAMNVMIVLQELLELTT